MGRSGATAAPGAAGPGAMPPLPPGLPPDAMKHAEQLWAFLDELADDPEAYQRFLEKQAAAAGVGDLDAFRTRMLQPKGGAPDVGAADGSVDAAAVAAEVLAAGGKSLPPELLSRLAAMGSQSGAAGAREGRSPGASPAAAGRPAAPRAPLVQELPDEREPPPAPRSPAAAAPTATPHASPAAAAQPPPAAPSPARVPPHTLTVEAASAAAPHGMLVLCAQLFDVASAAEVTLEATEHEAVLLRTGSEPATVLLRLALPERCTPAAAAAKWDKRARRLTVRLPCAPALV